MAHRVWECGTQGVTLGVCHMNKTIHTLTVIAIMIELSVLRCFIDPRLRKIRNEASSCPGIFSRNLRFYYVASSPGSPLPCLLDGHRILVGRIAIPAVVCVTCVSKSRCACRCVRVCVLLCFVDPILGNRYGLGVIP